MAKINLPKFIAEHYRGGVTAKDVVREALTNAIQAGGTEIEVRLNFASKQHSLIEDERNFLHEIEVIDNGEGFTAENLEYFDEICTSHKDSIGGKGVGRLSYLKYGSLVKITSQLPTELVTFPYTAKFSLSDVNRTAKIGPLKTSVSISDPKDQVYTQVTKLINAICDDLRLLLFLKKRSGQHISIKFWHNSTQPHPETYSFDSNDISPEIEGSFDIEGVNFECYLFRDTNRKGISAMLCADEVCVEEIVVSKRFDVCRYVLSVTSPYLDSHSNIERKKIELPSGEDGPDIFSPISRERLVQEIRSQCIKMVNQVGAGEIDSFKEQNIAKLRTYYPFISLDSFGGSAAFLDAEEVVRAYRSQQARREDKIIEDLARGQGVSWDDVSHLASEDLARYIVHRALLIDSLLNLPNEAKEDAVHNAILPKGSDGSDIRTNNVWIVDDKFLSYSSVYSDQTLRRIISNVTDNATSKLGRKPDIAAFFTADSDNNPNKLVIIEFKKPGTDIFQSNTALAQCRTYASDLCESIPTVREIFTFAVVDVDNEFYRDLRQQGFKPVFSLSEKVLYNDYSVGLGNEIPLHLYVTPVSALLKDAKARNRIFEEVLQFNVGGT